MAKKKIKINLAGKYYPVIVENEEEEEVIRRIEKDINSKINEFIRNYNSNNMQDITNLVLLDCFYKQYKSNDDNTKEKLITKLSEIENILR